MTTFRQFIEADYCEGLSVNADFWWDQTKNVDFLTMKGKKGLLQVMDAAAKAGGMTIFDKRVTSYGADPNFGFSFLIVLGQSHIMIHTWPEKYMMNMDVFTCGSEGDPHAILSYVQKALNVDHVQVNQNERGVRKDVESSDEKPDSPQALKK
jgi:S-adenosylmethionine decarboxylase proenzyme